MGQKKWELKTLKDLTPDERAQYEKLRDEPCECEFSIRGARKCERCSRIDFLFREVDDVNSKR